MSTEAPSGEAKYEISIIHPWHKDTISVAEIRELGGFPADGPVVAVDLIEGTETSLPEDATHHVPPREPGKRLVKRTSFKRG